MRARIEERPGVAHQLVEAGSTPGSRRAGASKATEWFTNAKRDRQQQFAFKIYRDPTIRDALNELSTAKARTAW
jgi:hypothetical protein